MSVDGQCSCQAGWTGVDCSVPTCHEATCMANGGQCSTDRSQCDCPPDRQGSNCQYTINGAHWESIPTDALGDLSWLHQGRASHSMVVYASRFYVFGGYAANVPTLRRFEPLLMFDPATTMWSVPDLDPTSPVPSLRFGHSATLYQVKLRSCIGLCNQIAII